MKRLSLRFIIGLTIAMILIGAFGAAFIASDLSKLASQKVLSTAAVRTQAACNEISKKYLLAEQSKTFSEDKRISFQSALLEIVLDHYEGVEGGFWNAVSQFTAYSYPTYEGTGAKTDVPAAEVPRIKKVIAESMYQNNLVSERTKGHREAVITTACPISKTESLWMMERVPVATSATLESVRQSTLGLFIIVGLMLIGLLVSLLSWSRALALEARDQREKLARVDRIRTIGEMAAGLAHDFREPLGSLRLRLENLAAQPAKRIEQAIPSALDQIDRMDRFVEMMLAMTRPFQLNRTSVDLKSWFDTSFMQAKQAADRKNVSLIFNIEASKGSFDPFQLARAVSNVIENAIAFTPGEGSVTVHVFATDPTQLTIDVRDSGPGLPEELKRDLFKNSRSTRLGGSGLGLLLAKEIVEAHGGRIEHLESSEQGAWFRLEIPNA